MTLTMMQRVNKVMMSVMTDFYTMTLHLKQTVNSLSEHREHEGQESERDLQSLGQGNCRKSQSVLE